MQAITVRLVLASAAAVGIGAALVHAGAGAVRDTSFPSAQLVGLKATVTFTVAPGAKKVAVPECAALVGLEAPSGAVQVSGSASPAGWAAASTAPGDGPASAKVYWHSPSTVGGSSGFAYAGVLLPVHAPTGQRGLTLWVVTSPTGCLAGHPYRLTQMNSPVGPAYPVLWSLPTYLIGAYYGLGCGFVAISTASSAAGTTITLHLVLTDALAVQDRTYQELACSSGRVVSTTTDPAETGADPTPKLTAAKVVGRWLSDLGKPARVPPTTAQVAAATADLIPKLQSAAAQYDFTVVSVHMVKKGYLAPFVVIEASDRNAIRSAVGQIEAAVDFKPGTHVYLYHGFFLEVLDGTGTPFLGVFNVPPGGGQWADDGRFPFPHG